MKDMDHLAVYDTIIDSIPEGAYAINQDGIIVFWNRGAERITGYTKEQALGKKCSDNLLRLIDREGKAFCAHGCPLADCNSALVSKEADVFLHHRNGHRVPIGVKAISVPDIGDGRAGCIEIFTDRSERSEIIAELEKLRKETLSDSMTGLGNRRFADISLRKACSERKRAKDSGFGVLLIDIDHFKQINDEYGHQVGDRAIRMIGMTLANAVRKLDSVSRWGGDEFIVIAPGVDSAALTEIATRVILLINRSWINLEDGREIAMTASIGGSIAERTDTPESILRKADKNLYASKSNGRNRFCIDPQS